MFSGHQPAESRDIFIVKRGKFTRRFEPTALAAFQDGFLGSCHLISWIQLHHQVTSPLPSASFSDAAGSSCLVPPLKSSYKSKHTDKFSTRGCRVL